MTVDGWAEGEWSIMDMVGRDDATEAVVAEGVRVGALAQSMGAASTVNARTHSCE